MFRHPLALAVLALLGAANLHAQTDAPFEVEIASAEIAFPQQQHMHAPAVVGGDVSYSNVSNYSGSGAWFSGAVQSGGNIVTPMVCDDLTLSAGGRSAVQLDGLVFTTYNRNGVDVDVRPTLEFFRNDGDGGGPGTRLGRIFFSTPITLAANNVQTVTLPVKPIHGLAFDAGAPIVWACQFYDNGGSSTTLAQMNNLGAGVFTPADVGSSQDRYFLTSISGDTVGNRPPGSMGSFNGNPLANFGWELHTPVFGNGFEQP